MSSRGRKLPEFLTEEEQRKLLNVFNTRYYSSLRNKAMIKVMLSQGLRLSEVVNLKWNQVKFKDNEIKVVEGKGRKDRMVFAGYETLKILSKLKQKQKEVLKEKNLKNKDNLVFTTSTGKKLKNANVRSMVYRYSKKAGIQEETEKHYRDEEGNILPKTYKEKKVSPHTLRHTFATGYYKMTGDIKSTQKALGHSDLSTTMIYTHLVDEDLKENMIEYDKKMKGDLK